MKKKKKNKDNEIKYLKIYLIGFKHPPKHINWIGEIT